METRRGGAGRGKRSIERGGGGEGGGTFWSMPLMLSRVRMRSKSQRAIHGCCSSQSTSAKRGDTSLAGEHVYAGSGGPHNLTRQMDKC